MLLVTYSILCRLYRLPNPSLFSEPDPLQGEEEGSGHTLTFKLSPQCVWVINNQSWYRAYNRYRPAHCFPQLKHLGLTRHSTLICHIWLLATLKAWRKTFLWHHLPSKTLIGQVRIPTLWQLECRHMPRPFLPMQTVTCLVHIAPYLPVNPWKRR